MTEPLWTLGEMRKATRGESAAPASLAISGISIDSRSIKPGEAFIALRGPNRDGHAFVASALEQGASLAIVDRDFPPSAHEQKLLRVDDTMSALNDLGRASRTRATKTKIIAVTGSAGKTGTKEALRLALEPSGTVHVSAKSHNNHWGVPLSLANMRRDTSFGVFEAGMNHAGELIGLSKLIRPEIAIVTTIEPVHLGFFPSVEAIADAKAEIFQGLESGGIAVLNRDNPHYERLRREAEKRGAKIVAFGEARDANVRLLDAKIGDEGSEVTADVMGETVTYRIGAAGRHLVQNSLAVLAAVKLAGADLTAAARALGNWQAEAGRGRRSIVEGPRGRIAIIDESYNANPASMRAALAILGLVPRTEFKRKIAVLGDMLELGQEGANLHAGLAPAINESGVDIVFASGPLMGSLYDALPQSRQGGYAKAPEELAPMLLAGVMAGDVVMVKGSFGSRMAPLVEALKRHFEGASATV
ncbi:MAG TPA: UDP-N-acetylmuramoylalanyl-D-glutamyl-2,6-diaminopimelate--D-alanyl-D-alanine ligase [Methyloceanibacter sp.]|nr:UDP-N-acetylmuramoylalanyl-D-glutamyl-2,6-diaminopimelate--D-alanyl-D-alanine ligase [Methyloceanibacter sp.]